MGRISEWLDGFALSLVFFALLLLGPDALAAPARTVLDALDKVRRP